MSGEEMADLVRDSENGGLEEESRRFADRAAAVRRFASLGALWISDRVTGALRSANSGTLQLSDLAVIGFRFASIRFPYYFGWAEQSFVPGTTWQLQCSSHSANIAHWQHGTAPCTVKLLEGDVVRFEWDDQTLHVPLSFFFHGLQLGGLSPATGVLTCARPAYHLALRMQGSDAEHLFNTLLHEREDPSRFVSPTAIR